MVDLLTEAQILEFKQGFSLFDKNGSGALPFKDVGPAMRHLGVNITDVEVLDMINECSADRSEVDFPEFLSFMARKVRGVFDPKEELLEAFKVFDREGNGKIMVEEFKHVMTNLGPNELMTEKEIDEVIRETEVNGDGLVNYEEVMMKIKDR